MDHKEYLKAADYWKKHDKNSVKMSNNELTEVYNKFLDSHNTCALATGYDDFIRCTPIEYSWINGCLYMLSEGGIKFKCLGENRNVGIAVFDTYKGFGKLSSIQIQGRGEIVDADLDEYSMVLKYKKIPEAAIKKLEHPMYLIKVIPESMDLLFSEFKEKGYGTRQHVDF